jgi:rare lipoprotein A
VPGPTPVTDPPGLDTALVTGRIWAWGADWGCNMPSLSGARVSCVEIEAGRSHPEAALISLATVRNAVRPVAVALAAALLAACAQSSVVTRNSGFVAPSRQAALQHNRPTSFVTHVRTASTRTHAPFAPHKDAAGTPMASHGIASFYTEGTRTANGEKFDTYDLTAAHPTLPFGTRLRVTNAATGRSVTVRVNDRGPYVPGRIVDVSYSAADALGIVGQGIANVKLDVIQ